jgi:hypothetical protein
MKPKPHDFNPMNKFATKTLNPGEYPAHIFFPVWDKFKKLYLAGPMRGYEFYNFNAFEKATAVLRGYGFAVVSPHELDIEGGFDPRVTGMNRDKPTLEVCMARDLAAVASCDAVVLLDGWESSEGVSIELTVASMMRKGILLFKDLSEIAFSPKATTVKREPAMIGIGGAPMRASIIPQDAKLRKQYPMASGLLDYFPDALAVISNVSYLGNEQHNSGKPIHWDRSKSGDESDTIIRHFAQRGTIDSDGVRHSAKMAWRALALLQKEIEKDQADCRLSQSYG